MHVQHDLSLTVIVLIVSYLIGHFVISANSMQVVFFIIHTARKYKRLTSNQLTMNIEKIFKVCERASLEISHLCVPKLLFFLCLSWYLRILSACLSVTLLHNVRIFCAVSLRMLMTWHYKRLTNCRQHAHIEIIYVCEHFCIQYLLFLSLFLLVLQIFCRYDMTLNREILGGGDDNTGHPPPHIKYWGDNIPPPHPPRDRHPFTTQSD